jgi:nitronate monooxygenase
VARSTPLTELLGIEHPLIQAPMAVFAGPELAAAVSKAGGLGSLGTASVPPADVAEQANAVRAQTDAPFAINFFCHEAPRLDDAAAERAGTAVAGVYAQLDLGDPPAAEVPPIAFDDDRLAAALESGAAVVSFHFGLPASDAVDALHERGATVMSSATTVDEAVELERRGADVVIAQGAEAGGHRASFLVEGDDGPVGTMALVPQVADAVDVPVVAAGGIADGRGLAASLALGAAGAQIGTAYLACPETNVHPLHRTALADARADRTTITRNFSGRPARALRNEMAEMALGRDEILAFPAQLSLTAPLSHTAAERGSSELMAMWAGQGAPLANEQGAAELTAEIAREGESALRSLGAS